MQEMRSSLFASFSRAHDLGAGHRCFHQGLPSGFVLTSGRAACPGRLFSASALVASAASVPGPSRTKALPYLRAAIGSGDHEGSQQASAPSNGADGGADGERRLSEFVKPRGEAAHGAGEGTQFVVPRRRLYPLLPCWRCKGSKQTACSGCAGQGRLPKGGYHRRNPVRVERLVGSKWTAMEPTFGWRHFRAESRKRGLGNEWFVEMVATCDGATRFWVNAGNLKDRERWTMGWIQKAELLALAGADRSPGNLCKACRGSGVVHCAACKQREQTSTEDSMDIVDV